jgi:Mor family transcriptional regulator
MNLGDIREALYFLNDNQQNLVIEALQGESIYIPKFSQIEKSIRNGHIMHDYHSGVQIRSISKIYKLTQRHVRRIIQHESRQNDMEKDQD